MRAVYYEQWGGADVLTIGELPEPEPAAGEVVIRVRATSVNPIDWKIREGQFECVFDHEFPIIPGWDAAGEIAEVGDGVEGFAPGDRVYAYCRKAIAHDGTYADYIRMPAEAVAPMPQTLSFEQAAAVPLCALTSWQSLYEFGALKGGNVVLIHAGAGGVGSYAIQLAKYRGATVLTTASPKNFDYVYGLGADMAIDYNAGDWRGPVQVAYSRGIDMIFDCVGGRVANDSVALIKPGGALACLNEPADDDLVRDAGIRAMRIFAEPNGAQLGEIAGMIDAGSLRLPEIDIMDLDQAAEAMARSQAGHVRGKIVLKIA